MNYITSWVSIDSRIQKDGKIVFEKVDANDFLINAYESLKLNYPKFYKMDELARLGFLASELLLRDKNVQKNYSLDKVGVVLSNASSSLVTDKKYLASTLQIASPALFVYTLPNIVAGEICIRHGLKGENGFFIFESFQAKFMANYVNHVLHRGSQACVAGWIEANESVNQAFLYLVEKEQTETGIPHTLETLNELFNSNGYIKD